MPRSVAIIGAGGKMGSWFTRFFASRNFAVSAYDSKKDLTGLKLPPVTIATTLAKCVGEADLVLVCVPVRLTPKIVNDCALYMKKGATLAEISSVKHKTFQALSKTRKDLRTLCLHPMFGPGATDETKLKILLIPVRDESDELQKAKGFLERTTLRVIPTAKDHDIAIGIVLGLTYFSNLAFADSISSKSYESLAEVAGTTFRMQSILAESILTDEVDLISVLIMDNPHVRKHIKQFLARAGYMARLASQGSPAKFEAEIRKVTGRMAQRSDLKRSYERLYAAMQSIDK